MTAIPSRFDLLIFFTNAVVENRRWAVKSATLYFVKVFHQRGGLFMGRCSASLANPEKLSQVNAPLAKFVVRNQRGFSVQFPGQSPLRQSCFISDLHEPLAYKFSMFADDCLFHARIIRAKRLASKIRAYYVVCKTMKKRQTVKNRILIDRWKKRDTGQFG